MEKVTKKPIQMPLTKKWFDMILAGEKKEEYRSPKPYWSKRLAKWPYEKTAIEFRNGYGKKVPAMVVEIKNIVFGEGREEWGAKKHTNYFVIQLGKILETKNIKKEATNENA